MNNPGLEFWHHHVGVSVPDINASIAWYRDTLGFVLERRYVAESIPATIAVLKNGPMHVELFELSDAKPLPDERREPNQDLRTHGNKHVAFAVADVRLFAAELKQRGADIVWVKDFKFGSNAFIRDNAGNLIEFVQKAPVDETCGTI
jgi:methylmalonyl-CoA/ethylmalonyl-CoA epimerase